MESNKCYMIDSCVMSIEGGGEVNERPEISQGGSTVTVRLKLDVWGDLLVISRSLLHKEHPAISEKNFNYSLQIVGEITRCQLNRGVTTQN